jgi:RNA polymerase sigma factor (TIGR02999 family)
MASQSLSPGGRQGRTGTVVADDSSDGALDTANQRCIVVAGSTAARTMEDVQHDRQGSPQGRGSVESGEFTQWLLRFRAGEQNAQENLIRVIMADLRRLAHRHLAGNRWMTTLDTTSIVNESYLRLVSPAAQHVETRAHFMNLASRVMRQILCDYARKRLTELNVIDRGAADSDLDEATGAEVTQARQFSALDEALDDLARINPRQAQVIECRFFAGLSEEETSEALDTSLRTVQRDWNEARAWLAKNLREA